LLAVFDGNDNLLQRYTYADARMPVSMTAGGATYFLLTDQVGTLRAVADTSGSIVKRIDYDSFVNIIADTNPAFTVPFGFAGGLHDRDTGLVRFGYRDYSPELGRFTAKDPIDFNGGDTNLYAYVLNDPINIADPNGLYGEDVHLDLTLRLALNRVGMNPNVASTIAQADQGLDTGVNNPFNPLGGLGLHFQSRVYAQTGIERAIEKGDPTMFGEFLHMMQDSYSHKGYSWPFGHGLDSLLGYGPDTYDECNPRDYQMKDETIYWLTEYMKKNRR
jgi:RHS repeat-associated protein